MGSGTHLLGHSFLKNNGIEKLLDNGIFYSNSSQSNLLEEKISSLYDSDRVIFCSTGSEANEKAIRACKAYTGKTKIAMFSGSWHGSCDSLLYQEDWSVLGCERDLKYPLRVATASTGINDTGDVDIYPYNSVYALESLESNLDQYAAVIIEPVQGSNPRENVRPYLKKLERIVKDNNVPLIFDEIVTGFRVGMQGIQGWYGLNPDITTLGKVIGGGFPIGVIVGNRDILEIDGVYYGGTFSGHPISCSAGNIIFDYLENNPDIYEELYVDTEKIVDSISEEIEDYPVQILKCQSFFRFVFTDDRIKERRDREDSEDYSTFLKFRDLLEQRGVLVGTNGIFFVCPEHNFYKDRYIQQIIESLKDVTIGSETNLV